MKKMFTRRLFIYMLSALIITISTIFVLQTVSSQEENMASSRDKLDMVKAKIVSNETNIASLTENLGENNLAKTRAFADMLAIDPSINGDAEKLNEIKDRLMVNELHIIDENGIITVPGKDGCLFMHRERVQIYHGCLGKEKDIENRCDQRSVHRQFVSM